MYAFKSSGILPDDDKLAKAIVLDADNYILTQDSLLYHLKRVSKRYRSRLHQFHRQLVVPECWRDDIMRGFHEEQSHAKFGKQYLAMLEFVYWRDMSRDLAIHIAKCQQCNMASRQPPTKVALEHPDIGKPFEHITIDHLSMCPVVDDLTNQIITHCLVVVDRLSQFVQCYPCRGTSAQEASALLTRHWLSTFGYPRTVQSDAASCYVSDLFAELMRHHKITHNIAASGHHQSQSRAESANKFVVSALRRTLSDQKDWLKILPKIVLSLNTTPISTIGLSAYQIAFGQRAMSPASISLPPRDSIEQDQRSLAHRVECVRDATELATTNTQRSFAQADRYFKADHFKIFHVGQRCLLYDEHVPAGTYRKFHRFYRPCEIIAVLPHNCYTVKDLRSLRTLPVKIHANRLQTDRSVTEPTDALTDAAMTMSGQTNAPQHRAQADTSDWHKIDRVISRRRTVDGKQILYKVKWFDPTGHDSFSWLPSRDITPVAIKEFLLRIRRHQRK